MRICPICGNSSVDPEELAKGSRCLSCHSIIEVNIVYAIGISLLLLALALLSFKYDQGVLGLLFTITLVLYSSCQKKFTQNYLPLKAYEDENRNT